MTTRLDLKEVRYADLNSRQKENYNFAKVSALLADYGFHTLRLTDDWKGADFIAQHIDGEQFLLVQLKGRLYLDTKYKGKDIWICFFHRIKSQEACYLYPHDEFLKWALKNLNVGNTAGWKNSHDFDRVEGVYSWPGVSKQARSWLADYVL